jgi:hypothetical protein
MLSGNRVLRGRKQFIELFLHSLDVTARSFLSGLARLAQILLQI